MRSDEFDAWVERHCAVFSLAPDFALRTMSTWFNLFAAAGYSAAELTAATDWLAVHAPPKFPSDHLRATQDRIKAVRAVEYRKETFDNRTDRGTCERCGGSGRVVVPHLAGIREGRWLPVKIARGGASYYTMAVLCSCALGRWIGGRQEGERRLMAWEEYQLRNPEWARQLDARRREQGHEARLKPMPDWLKAVMERLSQQANGADQELSGLPD